MGTNDRSTILNDGYIKKKYNFKISSSMSILIVNILVIFILSMSSNQFFTVQNSYVIIQSFSITAIVGLSQMVVLGSGGMNLSVGAIGGLAGIVTGGLMSELGAPIFVSILVGIVIGAFCGISNGFIIARMGSTGVAAFLTTLATSSVFLGLNLGITKSKPYYNLDENFTFIGNGKTFGIPIILIVTILIVMAVWFLFKYMGLGRQILSIGGNLHCSELSGIRVRRVVILTHVISGVLAALAGILLISYLTSAEPDVGSDWMLFSFAAPLIGGTRLTGGNVNVIGTFLGAMLLALISNGLIHLNLDIYWMTLIQGLVILIAVSIDRIRAVREENSQRIERLGA